jgi:hypothetical protein
MGSTPQITPGMKAAEERGLRGVYNPLYKIITNSDQVKISNGNRK